MNPSRTLRGQGLAWTLGVVLTTALLIGGWAWIGRRVTTAAVGLQYPSLSYVPVGADESPEHLSSAIPRVPQIERDVALMSGVSKSIRIYGACDEGASVLRAAQRRRMTVWLGVWVGRYAASTRRELECGIRLARQFPTTVERVIVGNEAVTRQDISIADLLKLIDEAKGRIAQPIGYADVPFVWESELRLAPHVDEIVIHLLPYWDSAFESGTPAQSARGVMKHLDRIQALYPKKRIIVGEIGWPTFGDQRFRSVPSRVFQANFLAEFARLAHERQITFNVIEAFDQRWKVETEGVVGGQWGVFDNHRRPKVDRGGQVSEDPFWYAHALSSIVLMGAGIGVASILMRRYGIAANKLPYKVIIALCCLNGMAGAAAVEFWRQTYDLTSASCAVVFSALQIIVGSIFSLRWAEGSDARLIGRDERVALTVALFAMYLENLRLASYPISRDITIWAFLVPIVTSSLAMVRDRLRTENHGFGTWIIALLNILAVAKTAMVQGYVNVQINMWLGAAILIALPHLAYGLMTVRRAQLWWTLGIVASFVVFIYAAGYWDVDGRAISLICQSHPGSLTCWRGSLSHHQVLGWLALLLGVWALSRGGRIIAMAAIHVGILAIANWNLTLGSFGIALAALALDAPKGAMRLLLRRIASSATFGSYFMGDAPLARRLHAVRIRESNDQTDPT